MLAKRSSRGKDCGIDSDRISSPLQEVIVRLTCILIALIALFSFGCAEQAAEPEATTTEHGATMPDDDVHRGMTEPGAEGMHGSMGTNAEIHLDEAVASAWGGIAIRLVDRETEATERYEIDLGQSVVFGDTGLTVKAVAFIPDFVMDESGITSRSAEANNPAAKVVISEQGTEDFEGWLFATMPEIHPYPHERYHVLLEAGLPAE
jgi:hypothetical protein